MKLYTITNQAGQIIRLVNLSRCLDISIGNKLNGEYPVRCILVNGESVTLKTFSKIKEASAFLTKLKEQLLDEKVKDVTV